MMHAMFGCFIRLMSNSTLVLFKVHECVGSVLLVTMNSSNITTLKPLWWAFYTSYAKSTTFNRMFHCWGRVGILVILIFFFLMKYFLYSLRSLSTVIWSPGYLLLINITLSAKDFVAHSWRVLGSVRNHSYSSLKECLLLIWYLEKNDFIYY